MVKKKSITQPYEPTPQETEIIAAHRDKVKNQKPAPALKFVKNEKGKLAVNVDHKDQAVGWTLYMESLGSADSDFVVGFTNQLINEGSTGSEPKENEINYLLSIVRGIEPRDPLETMLALQMAAVHNATMTFSRRLATVTTIPQQDSAERAFNKLARTFTTQIEALKRYRSTGESKVTVQHVTVNEGGQAVIGDVTSGGGQQKSEELPHAKQISHAPSETLSRQLEAVGETVPSSGG
ncbi:MAG: hypothetical protein HOP36_17520 [Methyloglobulus sp.]|nr:hypothetical protein [Methyloglobulus sp.]